MNALVVILSILAINSNATQLRAGHRGKGGNQVGGHLVGGVVGGGKNFEMSATQVATATQVANSLQEVIEVLSSMLQEFNTQAQEDKANWEKYSKWSDDSEVDKNDFINDQKALIMSSESKKAANQQMVQKLVEDLGKLNTEIMETEASLKQLAQMRAEERAQFEAALADVTKTIKAVVKATQILEGHYNAAGAQLAEIRARVQMALTTSGLSVPTATQDNVKVLASLLQSGKPLSSLIQSDSHAPDYLGVDGQEAYGKYESQEGGHGVMGMLSDLKTQLETQRQELVQKENESQRQYEETKAAKEADLAAARTSVAEKTEQQAQCEATIEEMTATVNQATKDIADAEAYLKQLLADRAEFTKMFGDRTAMRKQEQAATQAALDALQSVSAGAKAGVGEAASFIQISKKSSNQAATNSNARAEVKAKVVQITTKLIQVGREMHSMALVRMASSLKEAFDPYMETQQQDHYDESSFSPVIKLLTDLIAKLEEEANAETSQHEWCETEKASGVANQQEREKNIHALKGTIEALTTEIAQLKTEILFLESEMARVQEETRIAKQIRADENAVFVQAKKDHEEVITAIQAAIKALTGQYSLIQVKTSSHQSPFTEYKSGAAGAGSAMEMLEDLLTRYTEALTTLVTEEEEAQAAHEDLLKRNAQFLAETTATRNAKLSERRRQINQLASDKEGMKVNLVELHDVSKYLQDLRPSCDDIRTTYEERKKRREAEISALKEALEVLSDPSMMA